MSAIEDTYMDDTAGLWTSEFSLLLSRFKLNFWSPEIMHCHFWKMGFLDTFTYCHSCHKGIITSLVQGIPALQIMPTFCVNNSTSRPVVSTFSNSQTSKTTVGFLRISTMSVSHCILQITH